jgi:hypothetical protein
VLKFTSEFTTLTLDIFKYNEAIRIRLENVMREAAIKFKNAAIKKIPLFNPPTGGTSSFYSTGFVAGAFGNISGGEEIPILSGAESQGFLHELGHPRFARFTQEALRGFFARNQTPHGQRFTDIAAQRNRYFFTRKKASGGVRRIRVRVNPYYYPDKVLKTPQSGRGYATPSSEVIKSSGPLSIIFNYEIDITYFTYLEKNRGYSPASPWHAMEAGREAFMKYLSQKNTIQSIFPDINDYIVRGKISG